MPNSSLKPYTLLFAIDFNCFFYKLILKVILLTITGHLWCIFDESPCILSVNEMTVRELNYIILHFYTYCSNISMSTIIVSTSRFSTIHVIISICVCFSVFIVKIAYIEKTWTLQLERQIFCVLVLFRKGNTFIVL